MSINYWLESVIDAYLIAVAQGRDWRSACEEAERTNTGPVRVLTQADLSAKGLRYSRQHVARKVADKTFPPPFQLPSPSEGKAA